MSAGFFNLRTDEPTAVVEERCRAYAAAPPTSPTTVDINGQKFSLKKPEWVVNARVFIATMWRVRERELPSHYSEQGDPTPVGTSLSEAASFAYRPAHDLALIQANTSGPRHNRAAMLLHQAGILKEHSLSPEIVTDGLKRMKDAALLRRIEFSLTGIDSAKETELRAAGLGGALDDMKKYGGTSLHLTLSLGHTSGDMGVQARGLLERLCEIESGVRTVKASVKETQEHDVELLDLINGRSRLEFEVDEVGRELNHQHCRERLLFAIVNR